MWASPTTTTPPGQQGAEIPPWYVLNQADWDKYHREKALANIEKSKISNSYNLRRLGAITVTTVASMIKPIPLTERANANPPSEANAPI